MNKIEYMLKHNLLIQRIYRLIFSIIFRFLGLFIKKDKKRVLFQSMIGKNFGDSPKCIYDQMKKDSYFKDYKYVWAFENPDNFVIEDAKKVKLNSLSYFIESLRCGIWVTNVNIERGLNYKPKHTIYLNTWHGVTLKLLGNAQINRNDYDYSDVDYMLSSCDYLDKIFISDFKVKKESLVRCGLPRNDFLYSSSNILISDLRKKYNIPENKKVILYAPTWRDSSDGGNNYVIKPPIDIEYFRRKLSNDYVILFRMHHLTTEQLGLEFDDFVRDYSGNYDINELMMISDILISDYSATIFDYSILERPILLFAYDYDEYKKTRGLYIDLDDLLPGCVVKNQEDLIEHILNINYKDEINKVKMVKNKYNMQDGDATEMCIKLLKKYNVGDSHE